jgi:predicted amidohydrolase YtcJ
VPLPVDDAALARLDAVRAAHADDPVFRVDAVALKAALLPAPPRTTRRTRTAQPVKATPELPREVSEALAALDRRGWNVVLQVDDELALAATLDALAALNDANAPARDRRHRIELSRPMPLDVGRIKALGVAVSLPLPSAWAPGSALIAATTPDTPAVDPSSPAPDAAVESAAVGAAAGAATPAADPHAGLRLLMASESLADPRLGLQALLAGPETADAPASTAPVSEAALAAALDAYTSTAAWASGDERRRGTLARDMLADIVILSADLFKLSADKLLDAVVTVTIFDGKVVYDREAESVHTTEP